jgi:hypothetical protein
MPSSLPGDPYLSQCRDARRPDFSNRRRQARPVMFRPGYFYPYYSRRIHRSGATHDERGRPHRRSRADRFDARGRAGALRDPVSADRSLAAPAQLSQALVVQALTQEQFDRYGTIESAATRGRAIREATIFSERRPHFGRNGKRPGTERGPTVDDLQHAVDCFASPCILSDPAWMTLSNTPLTVDVPNQSEDSFSDLRETSPRCATTSGAWGSRFRLRAVSAR